MALKILLADDSMTAQNMGKKILSEAGYEVLTVSNGAAAVKKLTEAAPDIAVLDVYMPGYTGLEVCERIKSTPATSRIPVLLTVGKMEPFRPEEGMKAKADGVIIKPFEATDLVTVIEKLALRTQGIAPVKAAPQIVPPPAPAPAMHEEVMPGEAAGNNAIEAQHFVVDEESEPVFSAAGLETFAPSDEIANIASEPQIEFTAARPVEVATERISGFEPTAVQETVPADNAVERALEFFGRDEYSAISTQDSALDTPREDDITAAGKRDEGSEALWEAVESESTDADADIDLEAEMRRAQLQRQLDAVEDEGPAPHNSQPEMRAIAAGAGTGSFEKGVPLLAPIGKTSFDEFDSIMAETASRFEASAATAAEQDKNLVPEVEAEDLEPARAAVPESQEEHAVALEVAEPVPVLPELISEERSEPVFTEPSVTMRGSNALSGVFEVDTPKPETENSGEQQPVATEHVSSTAAVCEPEIGPAAGAAEPVAAPSEEPLGTEEEDPVWATIVPERVEREFSLPPMKGAADTAADTQAANSRSAQAEPEPGTQTNTALDDTAMNALVERVVDRVLERLKPVLVVTVEEILKEFRK